VATESLRYNGGKPQWSLVDFDSLEPLARVLEYGEHKYSVFQDYKGNKIKGADISKEDAQELILISSGRDNWKIGFPLLKLLESLARHLFALMKGEKNDKESGLPHTGHIMANIMFYQYHSKIKDDEAKFDL
jgi:hypothetical protein